MRKIRGVLAGLLLLAAAGLMAEEPGTGGEPSLKERAHAVGEAVKGAARTVGHETAAAAHQVAEASVKAAHTVSSKTKAGYAKVKARIAGKRAEDAPSTSR